MSRFALTLTLINWGITFFWFYTLFRQKHLNKEKSMLLDAIRLYIEDLSANNDLSSFDIAVLPFEDTLLNPFVWTAKQMLNKDDYKVIKPYLDKLKG